MEIEEYNDELRDSLFAALLEKGIRIKDNKVGDIRVVVNDQMDSVGYRVRRVLRGLEMVVDPGYGYDVRPARYKVKGVKDAKAAADKIEKRIEIVKQAHEAKALALQVKKEKLDQQEAEASVFREALRNRAPKMRDYYVLPKEGGVAFSFEAREAVLTLLQEEGFNFAGALLRKEIRDDSDTLCLFGSALKSLRVMLVGESYFLVSVPKEVEVLAMQTLRAVKSCTLLHAREMVRGVSEGTPLAMRGISKRNQKRLESLGCIFEKRG